MSWEFKEIGPKAHDEKEEEDAGEGKKGGVYFPLPLQSRAQSGNREDDFLKRKKKEK